MIQGVGIDIIHNNQIKKSIKKYGERYLDKVFTRGEQEYCNSRPDPVPHFAARFAAKEACIKACGARLTRSGQIMRNMEVVLDERGCPSFQLHGETAERIPEKNFRIHLSLTHDKMVASAVAVLESVLSHPGPEHGQ